MADRSFVAIVLTVLAGAVIWAVHFLVVYGFTSLACARGLTDAALLGVDVVPLTVGVATVVAALATLVVIGPVPAPGRPALSRARDRRDAAVSLLVDGGGRRAGARGHRHGRPDGGAGPGLRVGDPSDQQGDRRPGPWPVRRLLSVVKYPRVA